MVIQSLKLKNFRNYDVLSLPLDSSTNIFYGDNAQGKTNILEAIYLAGTTKSHRGAKDREMISFGKEEGHIEMVVDKNNLPFQIDMHLKKNSPKGIAMDRIPIRRASELFGQIHLVFFSPEDLNIIKEGPGQRRRFIDLELSQMDRIYLSDLSQYQKSLNQRNRLLKDLRDNNELFDTLDIWDLQLAAYGEKVMSRRREFLQEMNTLIGPVHEKLTGGKEKITLTYEPGAKEGAFLEDLQKSRQRDLRLKSTSVGPHRDDICFSIGQMDLRTFGSQGQQRTAALSLKLAEIELVKKRLKDTPILLLDDVLSELDKNRQNYLLESIDGIQTLITCTGLDEFVEYRFAVNKIFFVKDGTVTEKN